MKHVISILVENKPGVLARIADLFSARGYNIDSLAVGETTDPAFSRITCSTSGSEKIVEQIVKHLHRLIDVLQVVRFPVGSSRFVAREMLLIKLRAKDNKRAEVMRIADIFKAKIVDVRQDNLTLEVTGDQEKLEAVMELLKPIGVIEIARTGHVALSRGNGGLQTPDSGKEGGY